MHATSASQLPLPVPRWLSAAEAAGYVGVDVDEFRSEVNDGLWPSAGRKSPSRGDLWDRVALDRASDQLSGIEPCTSDQSIVGKTRLTFAEAAKLAGCNEWKLRQTTAEELPRRGQGKKAEFAPEDVIAYASRQRKAKPEARELGVEDLLAKHRGKR
jgi:hypothetical protein